MSGDRPVAHNADYALPICTERAFRTGLTDEEFWSVVFRQDGPDYDIPEDIEQTWSAPPCPLCGELGACGYDAEGRVLIHAISEEVEDDG